MRNIFWMTVCSALFLTACGGTEYGADMERNESLAAPAPTLSKVSAESYGDAQSKPAPPPADQTGNPTSQSFLAYRYNYAYALPANSVAATAKDHAEICRTAGPAKCQILGSSTSAHSEDNVYASLNLRAEPEWLKGFVTGVQSDVEEAKGELTNSSVSAEDLTRSILDTDARLNAQKTLRTRLENLLETKDAKLPDLLALERELARVQGQIESATSTLNVLRKRVSMSVVDLNYQTKQVAVSRSSVSPIGRALKNFIGNFSSGLAGVIEFIAFVLPWLILIIPAVWLLRKIWRRRRNTKAS